MKNIIIKFGLFASILALHACIPLDTAPYDRETDLTFWEKPEAAELALNTCYPYLTNPHEIFYKDAMSDNAYASKNSGDYPQALGNSTLSIEDKFVQGVWSGRYAGIKLTNELLENIHRVPGLSDEMRKRYMGEAKVLRAISYYELVIRFGDIPYYTHVISIPESQKIKRTPKATVLTNILTELDEVLDNNMLPVSYDAANTGHLTRWAALAMKARVYMSQNMWTELASVTDRFMTDGGFRLFPSYEGLFDPDNENNSEVIIDVQYEPQIYAYANGSDLLPPTMGGYCSVSPLQSLVDDYIMINGKHRDEDGSGWTRATEYKNRDPRMDATIIYNGHSYPGKSVIDMTSGRDQWFTSGGATQTGFYTRKYYDKYYVPGGVASGLNIIYFRYADILLMHAEAKAQLGELTEEVWNKTIRLIRSRAGFTAATALDFPAGSGQDALIDIVRRERRCELALEGLRYTDIIRWRIAETVLKGKALGAYTGESGTIVDGGYRIVETRNFDKDKHYLWPVPEAERLLNKNLGQNPNW